MTTTVVPYKAESYYLYWSVCWIGLVLSHLVDLTGETELLWYYFASPNHWLRQVGSYLRDAGMAGLASIWAMARRRAKEYRRKVDAATRCSAVCPHT